MKRSKFYTFVLTNAASFLHLLGTLVCLLGGVFGIFQNESDAVAYAALSLGLFGFIVYPNWYIFGKKFDGIFKKSLFFDEDIDAIFCAPHVLSMYYRIRTRVCRTMLYSNCILLPKRTKTNPTLMLLFNGYDFRDNVNKFQLFFAYLYGFFIIVFLVLAVCLSVVGVLDWCINLFV